MCGTHLLNDRFKVRKNRNSILLWMTVKSHAVRLMHVKKEKSTESTESLSNSFFIFFLLLYVPGLVSLRRIFLKIQDIAMVVFKKQNLMAFVSETGQTVQTQPVIIHCRKNTVTFYGRDHLPSKGGFTVSKSVV